MQIEPIAEAGKRQDAAPDHVMLSSYGDRADEPGSLQAWLLEEA